MGSSSTSSPTRMARCTGSSSRSPTPTAVFGCPRQPNRGHPGDGGRRLAVDRDRILAHPELTLPEWEPARWTPLGFDLLINEMHPGRSAAPASSSGAAGAAGSTSAATGSPADASACWSSRDEVGRGFHLDRQQATGRALRRARRGRAVRDGPLVGVPGLGRRTAASTSTRHGARRGRARLRASGRDRGPRSQPSRRAAWSDRCRPPLEEELAAELSRLIPWVEQVRFLKTGAEAMAAAVRLARVSTGRDRGARLRLSRLAGLVPDRRRPRRAGRHTRALRRAAVQRRRAHPRADPPRGRRPRRGGVRAGHLRRPTRSGSRVLRDETARVGAVLVADEIKTAGRLAWAAAASDGASSPIWS